MRNAGLEETQAGIKIAKRNINNLRYADDINGVSLVAQMVKNLPAVWETGVRSLAQEDPLKKEMAAHSGTLAWKIPWTKEPGAQGNRLSCRDQEGRGGSEEAVPGPSVFPSGEPGVSGADFRTAPSPRP